MASCAGAHSWIAVMKSWRAERYAAESESVTSKCMERGYRGAADSRPCELCEAAELTRRYYEDDECWIADCEICYVPMVVWKQHDPAPDLVTRQRLLGHLSRVAAEAFPAHIEFQIDAVMRQIPDHFHTHARGPWGFRLPL